MHKLKKERINTNTASSIPIQSNQTAYPEYDYYYTNGYEPVVWKYKDDKYILVIYFHYTHCSKKVYAKSNNSKYHNVDIPQIYDSIKDTTSHSKQFRDHVEEIVWTTVH